MNQELKERINGTGLRYNSGKVKFHLIPAQVRQELFKFKQWFLYEKVSLQGLVALANHYDIAQNIVAKYPNEELNGHKIVHNWSKGQNLVGMYLASANRHFYSYLFGEMYDEDLGSHHMIPVAWNLIAFYHQVVNPEYYSDLDDRYWKYFNSIIPSYEDIYDREGIIKYLEQLLPFLESCENIENYLDHIIVGIGFCLDIYELDGIENSLFNYEKLNLMIDETKVNREYGTANTAK